MRFLSSITTAMVVGLAAAMPQPEASVHKRSPEPVFENGKYIVDRQTQFANKAVYTFESGQLPAGLAASNYGGGARTFTPNNVRFSNNYLELLVNGGQTQMPYTCSEVTTTVSNILYGSVRTTAILTDPAGVVNGMFFYKSDTQESDIEWLSDPQSQSNAGTRKLWFTNQDANGDGKSTYNAVTPPSNPTATEHEYRLDWTQGKVQWFVDGTQIWESTGDVPSVPGSWIWNNWSNGDKGWSAGPPAVDAVFKIKKIEMYYNTA